VSLSKKYHSFDEFTDTFTPARIAFRGLWQNEYVRFETLYQFLNLGERFFIFISFFY